MPDPVTHFCFGQDVLKELSEDTVSKIDLDIFGRALQGPDSLSTIGFFGGKNKKFSVRNTVMHKQKTGAFLTALEKETEKTKLSELFSLLVGMVCHYSLDRTAHPYIICKAGDYDGTEETYHLRSGHVRLEHSIDCYFIRTRYKKTPWRFSVTDRILCLKKLPEVLRAPLDRVFNEVYGWVDGFDVFNKSLRDERLFYRLMQDPIGLVHYSLRPLSFGKTRFCMFSYYRRDTDSRRVDYMNEKHLLWHHPFDNSIESRDSFFDLYDKAKNDALEMINNCYRAVYLGENMENIFGNSSYSTGLDVSAPENENKPVFEPLCYGHKYWNN